MQQALGSIAGILLQISPGEIAEATGLPLGVVLAIVITALVSWAIVSKIYSSRIDALKERADSEEKRANQLKRENEDLLEQSRRSTTPLSIEGVLLAETTFNSINSAMAELKRILAEELETFKGLEILNIGLDLEVVQSFLLFDLIHPPRPEFHDIHYRGLSVWAMEGPVGELIDGNSNIQSATARNVVGKLEKAVTSGIKAPGSQIEVRALVLPPVFHGFLVANRHLVISGTQVVDGKIQGGQYPYLYMRYDQNNQARQHFFELFRSWFEYLWDKGPALVKLGP